MKNEDYYIGIDMGTSSVGWAVTDESYHLLRAKGKDMWGIREFERAETAAKRRTLRCDRRRREREVVRIGLLKEFFADEIEKVDPYFYLRLENSKFYMEDKNVNLKNHYGIFDDKNYTDKQYYEDFKTIYHLRRELIQNKNAPYDVRLVFLAILNMFKHRGHFLLNGVDDNATSADVDAVYAELVDYLAESYDVCLRLDKSKELLNILKNQNTSRKEKLELLSKEFEVAKSEKKKTEVLKLLCGLSVEAGKLFDVETEGKVTICFNDYSYSDNVEAILSAIGEEHFKVIELAKQIYDKAALDRVLQGTQCLSEARCNLYEKHKEDLKLLKSLYKKYKSEEEYNKMFRSAENGTYSAYVNSLNSDDSLACETKYRRNMKERKQEDLYKTIKGDFEKYKAEEDVQAVLCEIEKETFLPKQLTGANGIIPNQVHRAELVKILANAEQYLPFLMQRDESGFTVSERIIQLFSFQIPYYIGPTSKNSKNGWVVRKEKGMVLPWNLEEKIDVDATSEKFINNLIRSCTYLSGEKVLPKCSLMYEAYCVLNEINNIKIDGEKITPDLKQKIYRDLFEKGKRITKKQLSNYLIAEGAMVSETQLSGIDTSINNSLRSYGIMYSIFGDRIKEDHYRRIAEEIIYWCTIFGESKKQLRKKLLKYVTAGDITEENVKRLCGCKFKDWGRLSKAILMIKACDYSTGEVMTLMQAMWDYNYDFMELINSDEFEFKTKLQETKEESLKSLGTFTFEDLDDTYLSAPVKRMVWQTILVLQEIEKIMGRPPKRIFLEMTRTDEEKGDKGRKKSRGNQLLELYKDIKNEDGHRWKEEIKEADENGSLRSKKLYLYYLQKGRDAYTGEPIDINRLFDNNLYDIDHIYPRHFVKDDSLHNNLVLVNKEANQNLKRDLYPLPKEILDIPKVRELWDFLHEKHLMSDEKYCRLTNRQPFSEHQMAGFISRQLVETSQAAKEIADIIKQVMPNSELVYSKAGNVSDFRRDNGMTKCRIINEFHHAKDAYLNIVVGNVYYTKFTQNPLRFITEEYAKDKEKNNYHLDKVFDFKVQRQGYVAWIPAKKGEEGTIKTVRKIMSKNTPIMTRQSFENKGELYNQTLYSKHLAKQENYVPIKSSVPAMMNVNKYGGYTSLKPAYFIFIEHGSKKKRKKVFEVISIYDAPKINSKERLKEYCEKELGYEDVTVIADKIKKNALIRKDGIFMYVAGMDSKKKIELHNATNICVGEWYYNYAHDLEKYGETGNMNKNICIENNMKLYELLLEKHTNSIFRNNPQPLGEVLSNGKERFENLELEKQLKVLNDLLLISSIGRRTVDLKVIGGPSEAGRIRISGNMTSCKELLLINQSVTGLYETIQRLV